jgi:putative methylase
MKDLTPPKNLPELAMFLDRNIPGILKPKYMLEQYTTPGDLAARILWLAHMREGLTNKKVADLGAGTCRLAIGAAVLGSSVVAVEADCRLLKICRETLEVLGLSHKILPVCSYITEHSGPIKPDSIDLVIMNPPFGVAKKGADAQFLKYAFSLRPNMIYAILKSGNINFHNKIALLHGYVGRIAFTYMFPIPAVMEKHRSRMRRISVDVIVFTRKNR